MGAFEDIKDREQHLLCSTYGRYPLAVERAQDTTLWDFDGNEYVDLLAGIAVVNVGHCRPEVTKAICDQAEKMTHVSNLFYQTPQLDLAEKLLATCHLDRVFYCNSGAEANEAAIKIARRYQRTVAGREAFEIITLSDSFHGRTLATLTATGQDKVKEGFAPLPEGFATIPYGDVQALADAVTDKTAAVLVEMIQGEGGVRPMDPEYATAIEKICRDKGALFMVDEIQTGLGRTGSMWAFQHYGVTPDVITAAKGLANGLPMGAMLCTEAVSKGFAPGAHATTFGGGPVIAAAACAVQDILAGDKLPERAAELGEYVLGRYAQLKQKYPDKIVDVRGKGLLLGVELAFPGQDVWARLLEKRFVLNLTHGCVLRIAPPLTIEREKLDRYVDALDDVLGQL